MKKIISIILFILLSVVLTVPAYAAGQTGQALLSKVVVADVKQSTSNPDEIINVTVTLQNLNTRALKQVMVGVSGVSSEALSLTNTYGPFAVDLEANSTGSVSFDLYVSPGIRGGNYPLTLTLTYVDSEVVGFVNEYYTVSDTRSISVFVDEKIVDVQTPKIIVSSYNIGVERVYIGRNFELTFTLQNTSDSIALTNTMLSFSSQANAYTPAAGASNQLYIGDIAAGGSYTGKINLKANNALPTGIYSLNFSLQYQDAEHNDYVSEAGMGIQLIGEETDETASPKVIVSSYEIGADRVFGGDTFEMTLNLKNTSTDTAANVLLSFTSDANAYVSVTGVPNQLYIGNIAAGDSYTGKLSLKANDALPAGTYNININIEYQDTYSNVYTSPTSVSIPLEQKLNLSIKSITLPDSVTVNTKALLNVGYENPSNSDLINLVMTLTGDIPEGEKTVSIGNVKAGSSGNVDRYITPRRTGTQEITVSFTFEDASGNTYSAPKRTVTLEVRDIADVMATSSPKPADVTGGDTPAVTPPKISLNSYWIYFVIFGVLLVIVAAIIVWRILYVRKKKTPQWNRNAK
ncbi:MAG: hypothetical protein GXY05_01705 [Clostridiales bacterium]|nr:hypothetical protein [Clostridiales bacterium]